MSQVIIKATLSAFFITALLIAGSSNPNDQTSHNPNTGKHPAAWLPAGHMTAANAELTTCASCHGSDFAGGIAQIACGLCHMGGATSMHPVGWLRDACFNHGVYALNNGTTGCANVYCHGASLAGVSSSGPSCTRCHSMPKTAICGSCHAILPATGGHLAHMTTGMNIVCGSCHASGCNKHNNGTVDVAIYPAYYAKSAGTVTFNVSTCSKISCHGGQTTPNWTGGTINVNTECTVCHAFGTAEYNSYSSGRHYLHLLDPLNGPQPKLTCTACHDTFKLATSHFTTLNTTAMEGPASATILNALQYSGGSCSPSCHGNESW